MVLTKVKPRTCRYIYTPCFERLAQEFLHLFLFKHKLHLNAYNGGSLKNATTKMMATMENPTRRPLMLLSTTGAISIP